MTRFVNIPLVWPLLLLLLGSLVGLFASYDPSLSLPVVYSLWGAGLLYVSLVWWSTTTVRVRRAAEATVLVAAGGALFLFLQYRHLGFGGKLGLATSIGDATSALFPNFVFLPLQQNLVANVLAGALPLACGLWLSAQGRWRHAWLGCALLIGAGIGLTVSRGAMLALVVCALVAALAWVAPRKPKLARRSIGLAGALALVATALVAFTPLYHADIVQALLARAADRGSLYRNALFLAMDVPLTGIGPGETFALIYSRYILLIQVPYLTYTHNLPLAIWLGQGLPGLLGFGGMLIAFTRLMWRAGKKEGGPLWFGAALGSLALLLHGFTDAPQYNTDSGWLAMAMGFAVLGVAVASAWLAIPATTTRQPLVARRRSATTGRRAVLVGRFVVAGASLLLVIVAWRPALATTAANLGFLEEARADLAPNLSDGERADRQQRATNWYYWALYLNPEQPTVRRRLGIHAMDHRRFDEAAHYLEIAWRGEPANQATRKALGLAYLWSGRVDAAVALLSGLDRANEVTGELATWAWWWGEQQRPDLSTLATQAAERMAGKHAAQGR